MEFHIEPKLNYTKTTYSLHERMRFYKIPGVSIAVIKDFKMKEFLSFGVKDIETEETIDKNTLFQAASISKPISALIVFRLIEKGVLNLDQNANSYLKDFQIRNLQGGKINTSIKRLLSHTAGLSITGFPGYSKHERIPTINQILQGIAPSNTNPVMKEFNSHTFNYSGGGYTVLQKIVEDTTNKPFHEVAQKELCNILNLKYSTFYNEPKTPYSCGHRGNEKIRGDFHIYPEKCAAGLWTTPAELSKIYIEVAQIWNGKKSKLLSTDSVRQILEPVQNAREEKVALGFFIKKGKQGTYFRHNGWNEGFQSKFICNVNQGFGIVAMVNSDNGFYFIDEIIVTLSKKYGWIDLENYTFH